MPKLRNIFPEYADDGRFWCKPLAKRATPGALPVESELDRPSARSVRSWSSKQFKPNVPRCAITRAAKAGRWCFCMAPADSIMDLGFLDSLAQKFHVYAPLVPGYGDSEECAELRDMLDFTLHTWDVVERLGLKDPILAGFSMGGMIASEMAAIAPNDVSRLALIAPAGLWMDEHPIPDIFAMLPYELPGYLFYDAEAGAKIMSAGTDMSDPKFLQAFLVQNARQLGAAGKILFPIPERGLASRLYRIKAKTMLIWGEGDKLIPPVYAQGVPARHRGRGSGDDSASRSRGAVRETGGSNRAHRAAAVICLTAANPDARWSATCAPPGCCRTPSLP